MTPADQIAEINRKADSEHAAVEQKRVQMIQQVRERCVHEWRDVTPFNPHNTDHSRMEKHVHQCKHCGQPMPGANNEKAQI